MASESPTRPLSPRATARGSFAAGRWANGRPSGYGTALRTAALAIVAIAAACTRPAGAPDSALPPESLPDQETWNAVLRLTDEGRLQAVLAAPYVARYERADSQVVRMGPGPAGSDTGAVRATLYDQAGAPRVRLRANRLRFDERTRQFTAQGNVLVRSPGGRSLSAATVTWSEADERLRVPGSFSYTSATERIAGVGLVASGDLSRYSFARARGTVEVRE